jgi:hypothetical protein
MQFLIHLHDKKQRELVYFCIKGEILRQDGIAFSDGNVAAAVTGRCSDGLPL